MRRRTRSVAVAMWLLVMLFVVTSAWAMLPEQEARRILEATGVQGGLVVHIGCGDGTLTAALRAGDRYVVHGLDADPDTVDTARAFIRAAGIYGTVSVDKFDGTTLPYTDNLVNLVVSDALGEVPMDEVMRVLVPNGVAYIKGGGGWTTTVKPWPEEIDEWTHFLHGANNNAVANDTVVGPPRRMQWLANPLWLRSHEIDSGVSAMVSARGRIFYILDEGLIGITDERLPATWSLVARDAFNGVLLWKRPITGWGWREWKREQLEGKDWTTLHGQRTRLPATLTRRLVAEGNRVYVTLGYQAPLTVLDAATGDLVRTCAGTQGTDEILCSRDMLVVCARDTSAGMSRRRGQVAPDFVLGVDAGTGEVVWKKQAGRIPELCLAVEDGRVYYLDTAALVCLGLRRGNELWRVTAKRANQVQAFVVHDGVVLVSGVNRLESFSAKTGKNLWAKNVPRERSAARQDLFVADGLVWRGLSGIGHDLLTGEERRTVVVQNLRSGPHHHRCYRNKATSRYIMSGKEGVEFLDLKSENHSRDNWLRGACKLGVMPCNGLLYSPSDQCFCEPGVKLLGFCALAPETEERSTKPGVDAAERLERGPAYSQIDSQSAIEDPDDWPTYRHDGGRSGSTASAVPAGVKRLWHAEPGGRVTAPVVADGKLFVASINTHTVHALSAETGEPLWSYTAGGRVDSPPTIYKGIVLFGSADGWVYSLRASDGEPAWRFRAAPEDRRVGAFGQLESAWPVHGSVLVQNGVSYCTAGRSSFLDDGIFVYGLDPATGEKLYEGRVEGPHADLAEGSGQSFWMDGARSDVLVGDGTFVYMRQVQFDNKLVEQDCPHVTGLGDKSVGLHLFSTARLLDGSWYNRTFWMYSKRWPGYYIANQAPKSGQLLVFDDTLTYGVKMFTKRNRHSPMFFPAEQGYLLFADDNDNEPELVGTVGELEPLEWLPQSAYVGSKGKVELGAVAVDKDKGIGFTRVRPPRWSEWLPVRIRAMALAGQTLFVAGPPDVLDPNDPLGAFEGRKDAVLWAVSAVDGKKLAEFGLDSAPVFDGMIAANARLYVSTTDGKVVCLGGK